MINRPKVKLWEKFPEITRMVIDDHKKMNALGGCHDLAHAFMVAQYARIIADNDDLARLGWIAGLGHNSDRLFSDAEGKKELNSILRRRS